MKTIRILSIAVLAATIGVTGLNARTSLSNADEPTEFPPASYKASQYVDSAGCAYVRSGHSGYVTWVPRVSRDRKVLCGFKPSLATAQVKLPVIPDAVLPKGVKAPLATVASKTTPPVKVAAKATTPSYAVAAPVKLSTQIKTVAPKPVVAPVRPAPQAAPVKRATLADAEIVGQTCGTNAAGQPVRCSATSSQPADYILKRLPAGITVRKADGGTLTTTEPTLVRVAIKSSKPAPVVAAAVLPLPIQVVVPTPAPRYVAAVAAASTCNGLSGNAAQYMRTSSKLAVRCGPQAVHPSAYIQKKNQRIAQSNASVATVSRRGRELGVVYTAPVPVRTPAGYKRGFDDGRINPNRGPRTLAGDYQQAQVWTNTVPAYPIETGAPRTFWQKLFGTGPKVAQRAVVPTRPSVTTGSSDRSTQTVAVTISSDDSNLRFSSKSVAPVTTPAARQTAPAGLRYVQVGTFGVPSNADKSIARLSAMGMPVSSQILTRKGKKLKMVLAGPFASPQQTMQALGQTRSVGYSDAFARK